MRLRNRAFHSPALLALVFGLSACGTTDDSDGEGGRGGDESDTGGGGDAGGEADVVDTPFPEVPDTTRDPSCTTGTWIVQVRGFVETDSGEPVQSAFAQICIREAASGRLTCLAPEDTHANGEFRVNIPENLRCMGSMTLRSLHITSDSATMYCEGQLDDASDAILEVADTLVLHETTRATTLPEMGNQDDSRAVVFSDGLAVDVVPARYYGPTLDSYDDLAAQRITATDLCFLEGEAAFDGLYAFSPEGDVDGDNFGMRVPNTANLAAGTSVGFYVLGGLATLLPNDTQVTEGEWYRYGSGTVSGDGSVIEGDGLPYFAWFAYRAE
jgi:hypothetical protein